MFMQISADAVKDSIQTDLSSLLLNPFITSDMTDQEVSALWLSHSIVKKWSETNKDADSNALGKFLACNEHCANVLIEPKELFTDIVLNQMIHDLDHLVNDDVEGAGTSLTLNGFGHLCVLGTGANIQGKTSSFYTKLFDSPLSTTDISLHRYYGAIISTNPTWTDAENARNLTYGVSVVEGSRLSFVPKTSEISRTICTEPVLNMFLQRGIGEHIETRWLSRLGICLDKQPSLNRELARLGSIDGSFATIDLRSASDCISIRLIDKLFPRSVSSWLKRTRSPRTILPDGSKIEMSMISSMGNGYTFPLQTLIFSSLVIACYKVLGIPVEYRTRTSSANWGVFGDDIIVRKDAYDFVVKNLTMLGFFVNDDKSFNVGSFRESCGGDFYLGRDIRGVYLKTLSHETDVYSALNRLVRWHCAHGVEIQNTLRLLSRSGARFLPIPFRDGDTEGIKVSSSCALNSWSDLATQGVCYKALQSSSRFAVLPDETRSRDVDRGMTVFISNKAVHIGYNRQGLVVSLVGGFIRSGRISFSLRERPRYVRVTRQVPWWDWLGHSGSSGVTTSNESGFRARWEACSNFISFEMNPGA